MKNAIFPNLMMKELERAEIKFEPINSLHEAKAVIEEELEEFWEEVKKFPKTNDEKLLKELVQIAAMCWRTANDLGLVNAEESLGD